MPIFPENRRVATPSRLMILGNVSDRRHSFRESIVAKKPTKKLAAADPVDQAKTKRSKPPIKVKKPAGTRKGVTHAEYQAIRKAAASTGRYPHRDATMIMLGFIHGFRCKELVGLRWEQVNLDERTLHVVRCKRGSPSMHELNPEEIKALRKLAKDQGNGRREHVFTTEREGPLTTSAFSKILARAGEKAGVPFRVGTHMLRHGCGYYFANKGKDTRSLQGYLGHRNISQTVLYTDLAADRFKGWTVDE
jgi:type 1 fimbriae regulatory protein FimB/type 1 fimbriae regulatory protein FimE